MVFAEDNYRQHSDARTARLAVSSKFGIRRSLEWKKWTDFRFRMGVSNAIHWPESFRWAYRIRSVHSSACGECIASNRWSEVYVYRPTVSKWMSRWRTQDTCNWRQKRMIKVLKYSCHADLFTCCSWQRDRWWIIGHVWNHRRARQSPEL